MGAPVNGMATAGPLLRGIRASVLSAVGLTTGVTFHVSADGLLPGRWSLLALWAVSTAAAAPFLGTPASARRVLTLLVVWQTLVHGALTVLSGHRGDLADPHEQLREHAYGVVWSRLHHLVDDMNGPHAAMAVGHLAAAALAGVWLAAGERALWRLFALAVRPVLSVVGACCSVGLLAGWSGNVLRPAAPQVEPGALLLSLWFLVRAVPRRGPPAVA